MTLNEERLLIIEPGRSDQQYWSDLWRYRGLFATLAWRDIAVRYKQTVIGASWAVLRPFLVMVVFTFIFGRVAGLPSDGDVPYAILVFAGMLPWFLFATMLGDASGSLVANTQLVGKIYFPRMIIPGAASMVSLVDFFISFLILFLMMLWYGFMPDIRILMLPVFIILALITGLGPSLLFGALNVRYRDFRYIIPFVIQFGLYVSPVGFSSSVISEKWRLLYSLNPMTGVIDGFRWCLLAGESNLYLPGLLLGACVAFLFLWFGVYYFRATEKSFADVI
ncbi:MAG: ABC transporter permease [Gammaproteobacteria bacterium]|jgi:lipopolysaccharide transport system permease protein|nr:ABC transporter permease [Bacteroidetes Order II. bacterium]MBT6585655.1 ABC transporter permease [Gammaproteobacteria bacterium]MBT7878886.1 ABC transporter permease [Gammaproteobacteria bacterium]